MLRSIAILFLLSHTPLLLISSVCGGDHVGSATDVWPPGGTQLSPINGTHRAGSCLDSERSALLQFKAGIHDPKGRLQSWMPGSDCCRWSGVACSSLTGAVVRVDLRNPNGPRWRLTGRNIDHSLLRLRSLTHLDLSGNAFHGAVVPVFLGSFHELTYLDLSHAGFAGAVPPQLGNLTRLRHLDLSSDRRPGIRLLRVHSLLWLSSLRSLRYLAMDRVDLSAVALDWMRQLHEWLPGLVELHLRDCNLRSAELVAFRPGGQYHFSNFTSLEVLDLSRNGITSAIPTWLSNVTTLVHLDVGRNQFHGIIPVGFSRLPCLEHLDLSLNQDLTADVSSLLGLGGWGSIRALRLSYNKLHGEIPSSVGNLTSLMELDLSSNNVRGGLPASIGNLCSLTELRLSKNNLTGELPAFLNLDPKQRDCDSPSPLPRLVRLILDDNYFHGELPTWVLELTNLQVLRVSSNQFAGVLTEFHLSKLRNLASLRLDRNKLSLRINSDWVPPFQLTLLFAGSCLLGPKFPPWIRTQKELRWLDISNNGIAGEVPAWFWSMSSGRFVFLNMSLNSFTGQVPSSWRPSPQAGCLDLSSNQLQGRLPSLDLLKLAPDLCILDLSSNGFHGHVWPDIGEIMPGLRYLSLASNHLTGEIPSTIRRMRGLRILNLSINNLTGGIPAAILRDCPSLYFLNLGTNNLSGSIPASLGTLGSLRLLLLNGNMLSGEIPASLRGCSMLEALDVGDNTLLGRIPTWIGTDLPALRILRLRSNRFSGEIPEETMNLGFLQVLDVAGNKLKGPVPQKVGSLRAMRHAADLYSPYKNGGGYFKFSLTVYMKGLHLEFDIKTDFLVTSIDFSGNSLSGEIPSSLTNLSGLVSLDISGNLLAGTIPARIGEIRRLQSLDLSRNHFSGGIPPSIARLSFLSFLNLSCNNLSGDVPAGGQMDTFGDSSYLIGNPHLRRPPLLPSGVPSPRDDMDSGTPRTQGSTVAPAAAVFSSGLGWGFALGISAFLLYVKFPRIAILR